MFDISQLQEIYSISRLNREVRFLLEGTFTTIWVEGEISNFTAHSSGHWYFSLKDNQAQVRCVLFKQQNRRLTFTPKDGLHVFAKGRVSLYEGRGDYQLLIEHLEEAGMGKLQKEFEALKQRLHTQGLFATAHKKPIPSMPQRIGIITSPSGAAIRDILHVLQRRFATVPVVLYPAQVQGAGAALTIVHALQTAQQRNECDVLILARGGGSLEDLWPFNEESVAQAIFACTIPIISGVGHEIDFTIADFVADLRAPTPSAAAELAVPDAQELLARLHDRKKHLVRIMQQTWINTQQQLTWLNKHLQRLHPARQLTERAQQLDLYALKLGRLQQQFIHAQAMRLQTLSAKLQSHVPHHRIRTLQQQLAANLQHLIHLFLNAQQRQQQRVAQLASTLDALSPLATLKRGFAIASNNGNIVRSSKQVKPGDEVHIRLAEGSLLCITKQTEPA